MKKQKVIVEFEYDDEFDFTDEQLVDIIEEHAYTGFEALYGDGEIECMPNIIVYSN